ncbi:hypothetical protein K8R42_03450 [bacterium]|nr:hypothetical protein [bacterium]
MSYKLDFHQSLSRDIVGWYPESRISQASFLSIDGVGLVAEPVYMKIYSPIDFEIMTVEGSIDTRGQEDVKLGLKQTDGSWDFKQIKNKPSTFIEESKKVRGKDFSISFDLDQARVKRNQLELILSAPALSNTSSLGLVNNWQIILNR